MSEFIKENTDGKEEEEGVEFGITRTDIEKTIQTFVKGMNQQEIRRFEDIYRKYEDKGQKVDMSK